MPRAMMFLSVFPHILLFRDFISLRKGIATKAGFPHSTAMSEIAPSDSEKGSDWVAPRRFSRTSLIFGGTAMLIVLLGGVAWWQRVHIAESFVQGELDKRGVRATYEIQDIGLRTQRIRNLVIGDPKNPDLTAKLIELDVALNFSGVTPRAVRAEGVWVRGKYDGTKFSFGELDKFSDPKSKEPFKLPDISLAVKNARARLDTPWGVVGAGLSGSGLLRNNFKARMALYSPAINAGDCRVPELLFDGKLELAWQQPRLIGPWSAALANCSGSKLAVAQPFVDSDIRLSRKFDRWVGSLGIKAGRAAFGDTILSAPSGRITLDGGIKRTNFTLDLGQAGLRAAPLTVQRLALQGSGYFGQLDGQWTGSAKGDLRLRESALDKGTLGNVEQIAASTKNTPIGPIMARIAPTLQNAGNRFNGEAGFEFFRNASGGTGVLLSAASLQGASGLRLQQQGVLDLRSRDGGWAIASPLDFSLSGGTLPNIKVAMRQGPSGQWSGSANIAPYQAGKASLAVPQLAFNGAPGGNWRINGQARLSGPLPGGFVNGLELPINGTVGASGVSLYNGCENFRFQSIAYGALALKEQSLRLCPDRGRPLLSSGRGGMRFAANLTNASVSGMLGGSPMDTKAATVRFDLSDGFNARNVDVSLGSEGSQTELAMAALTGGFRGNGIAGTLNGGSGKIGNVPLDISDAAGNWRYLAGALQLDGGARVSDASGADRFLPLLAKDMQIALEDGVITAIGGLHEPTTGRKVTDADIRHTLSTGAGRALLAVDGVTFDDYFQPELLTPLTLGVVANVKGSVSGDGRIEWDANGVRSSGRFETAGANLAAAFGPVEGLNGQIVFSDLLGLETGEVQTMKIASINPGIAAMDGTIRYRLLPGQRVQIEEGRWPFAGGELVLESTTLDFGVATDRHLTFRVIGMDAARFLSVYGFNNLQVSGVFDGTLPMVFNQDGGRIVGGFLKSRPGGGELSYLGDLTYQDMGVFANFAFNALKSIRYDELEIGVGGDLAGEIITNVRFAGVQQGSLAQRNFITKQLAKIPIQFNVSISAQFMQLIGTIRGLYDAQYAADQNLPFLLDQKAKSTKPDQDKQENTQ